MPTMHLIKEESLTVVQLCLYCNLDIHQINTRKQKQKTNTIDITAGWQKERQHQPQQQPGLQTPSSQK